MRAGSSAHRAFKVRHFDIVDVLTAFPVFYFLYGYPLLFSTQRYGFLCPFSCLECTGHPLPAPCIYSTSLHFPLMFLYSYPTPLSNPLPHCISSFLPLPPSLPPSLIPLSPPSLIPLFSLPRLRPPSAPHYHSIFSFLPLQACELSISRETWWLSLPTQS